MPTQENIPSSQRIVSNTWDESHYRVTKTAEKIFRKVEALLVGFIVDCLNNRKNKGKHNESRIGPKTN
jgi:hypothetical protein